MLFQKFYGRQLNRPLGFPSHLCCLLHRVFGWQGTINGSRVCRFGAVPLTTLRSKKIQENFKSSPWGVQHLGPRALHVEVGQGIHAPGTRFLCSAVAFTPGPSLSVWYSTPVSSLDSMARWLEPLWLHQSLYFFSFKQEALLISTLLHQGDRTSWNSPSLCQKAHSST